MRIVLVKLELQEQNKILLRIAEALERMAPPLKGYDQMGRKSDLSDLAVVDIAEQEVIKEIERAFAETWNVVPDSPAFQERLKTELEAAKVSNAKELFWICIGKKQ